MKKIVIALIGIFTITVSAKAQVSYSEPQEKEWEMISLGKNWLVHALKDYGFSKKDDYNLYVSSTNPYDDSIEIYLGNGDIQTMESLSNILKMIQNSTKGGYIIIGDRRFHRGDFDEVFTAYERYAAGNYSIYKSNIEFAIKWFNNGKGKDAFEESWEKLRDAIDKISN